MYYNQYSYYQQPQSPMVYNNYTNYPNYQNVNQQQAQSYYPQNTSMTTYNQYTGNHQANYEIQTSYFKPTYPYSYLSPSANAYNHQQPTTFNVPVQEKKVFYKDEYLTHAEKSYSIDYENMYTFNVSSSAKNLAPLPVKKRNTSEKELSSSKMTNKNPVAKPKYTKRPPRSTPKNDSITKPELRAFAATKRQEEEKYLEELLSKQKEPTLSKSSGGKQMTKTGLTATEDVDKLLEKMGYSIPPNLVENDYVTIAPKEKQDLMFSYGLTEIEFDKAEKLFKGHCHKGKFGIKSLAKVFPNNSLAERIQIPELTNDDGDFLKFEEYLNIYQILKDLDI